MEFIILIVLLIIGKFVYDWNKQNNKIAAEGGMRKKYAQFISHYESHPNFKVMEEKPDYIVFATLHPNMQAHFKLEENFKEVIVHYKSFSMFGNAELRRRYRVGIDQAEMFQRLNRDIEAKLKSLMDDLAEGLDD